MNWHHVIECGNTVADPLVCGIDNPEKYGFNELDFRKGESIKNRNDDIFFKANEDEDNGDPDDALQNHLGLPVYSGRLKNALNRGLPPALTLFRQAQHGAGWGAGLEDSTPPKSPLRET